MESIIKELTEEMMTKMRSILESGQEAIPMVFRLDQDDKVMDLIGIGGMSDVAAKDKVAELLKQLVAIANTKCVIFIFDGYVLKQDKAAAIPTGSLKNVPGRKEAIMASIMTRSTSASHSAIWEYERVDGKPSFTTPISWGTGIGRFANEGTVQ